MRISIIGSGNVATHLGAALKNAGHSIEKIWSRSGEHASLLAYHLKATPVNSIGDIAVGAELIIISVADDGIEGICSQLKTGSLVVHTSGSTGMNAIFPCSRRVGVLYPLQTFSKDKEVNFKEVPVLVEANSSSSLQTLLNLANQLSATIATVDSEKRLALHVAAVFASNFCNYMYSVAAGITATHGLSFDLLKPLILETADKVRHLSPKDAQTGPARRNDRELLQKHADFLSAEPGLAELYNLISQRIINFKP